jgi:hypothetical protein
MSSGSRISDNIQLIFSSCQHRNIPCHRLNADLIHRMENKTMPGTTMAGSEERDVHEHTCQDCGDMARLKCWCKRNICHLCAVPHPPASNVFCQKCRSTYTRQNTSWRQQLCDVCHCVKTHAINMPQEICGTGIDRRLFWQTCWICKRVHCSECKAKCPACSQSFCCPGCVATHQKHGPSIFVVSAMRPRRCKHMM